MKCIITLALASILFPGIIRAQSGSFDNSTVRSFDLDRYLGTWYEIARFDHSFERGMQNVSAEYLLRDDGMVAVFNSGWKDGKYKVTEGKAKQPDPTGDPAHLRVSFFLFFFSDYDVLMLDENYQIALVGSKSPNYLWILSRDPSPSDKVVGEVIEEADRRGYDTSKLIWVDQSMNDIEDVVIL
ncbi:MAG: lipocalin family protein [Bacteroidales bacterium]|nr:lipocalin family protein [Bacteroidales bacterium]